MSYCHLKIFEKYCMPLRNFKKKQEGWTSISCPSCLENLTARNLSLLFPMGVPHILPAKEGHILSRLHMKKIIRRGTKPGQAFTTDQLSSKKQRPS